MHFLNFRITLKNTMLDLLNTGLMGGFALQWCT